MTKDEKELQEQLQKQKRDYNRSDMKGYSECSLEISKLEASIRASGPPGPP